MRLRGSLFNTQSVRYAAMMIVYRELQTLVDHTPKQGMLVVQDDWNANVGEAVQEDWR